MFKLIEFYYTADCPPRKVVRARVVAVFLERWLADAAAEMANQTCPFGLNTEYVVLGQVELKEVA